MITPEPQKTASEIKALKNLATVVYALQAATMPLVVTYFIAPLLVLWKRKQAKGTWVESHLRWQLNTFWFSLIGFIIAIPTLATPVGVFILAPTVLWLVYRIGQGWTRLSRGQPMLGEARKDKAVK